MLLSQIASFYVVRAYLPEVDFKLERFLIDHFQFQFCFFLLSLNKTAFSKLQYLFDLNENGKSSFKQTNMFLDYGEHFKDFNAILNLNLNYF